MDETAKKSKRTVPGDCAVVQANRLAKGWSVEQLAGKAGFTPKTIERLEAGNDAYVSTWNAVAEALNIDVNALLNIEIPGKPELSGVKRLPTVRLIATARVEIPKALLDNPQGRAQWVMGLRQAIGANATIEIVELYEGSTYVRFSIRVDDFQRMCELFLSGELAERDPDLRILAIFASDPRDPDARKNSQRRELAELLGVNVDELDKLGEVSIQRRQHPKPGRKEQ